MCRAGMPADDSDGPPGLLSSGSSDSEVEFHEPAPTPPPQTPAASKPGAARTTPPQDGDSSGSELPGLLSDEGESSESENDETAPGGSSQARVVQPGLKKGVCCVCGLRPSRATRGCQNSTRAAALESGVERAKRLSLCLFAVPCAPRALCFHTRESPTTHAYRRFPGTRREFEPARGTEPGGEVYPRRAYFSLSHWWRRRGRSRFLRRASQGGPSRSQPGGEERSWREQGTDVQDDYCRRTEAWRCR
jgi:hypothetical protein